MKQVLIAEDNSDLRTIFARIFLNSAFEVRLAVDGRETLAQLAEAVPDILILDINMPHISGLDVLTYIRQKRETQNMKVIVVTGNFLAQQSPEAELADLFLVKPVSVSELTMLAQRLSS